MISIIIPVYNQANKLDKCLESIKKQTYPYYEIIIINDGSTDNLSEILEKHKKNFPTNFRYFSQENKGANAARNYGYRVSWGEFILFCDADIILREDMLEKMKNILRQFPEVSYVYSSHKYGYKNFKLHPFNPKILKTYPYIHTTSLIKKSHFPPNGWDEKIKRLQDWDLWLTMLEKGRVGIWINEYLFSVIAGGTMSSWLPSFVYKFFPFLPKVKNYNKAVQIIKEKHHLV